jgi:glutathione S-transferase
LNYKKIPFETVWIALPDIKEMAIKVGASSTRVHVDGSLGYTIPFLTIEYPGTSEPNTVITESTNIARYFDAQEPDPTCSLFPKETTVLDTVFSQYVFEKILMKVYIVFLTAAPRIFDARAAHYLIKSRELVTGVPFDKLAAKDEVQLEAAWKDVETAFDGFAALLDEAGEGNYRLTGRVTYAEIEVVSLLHVMKALTGDEPNGWKRLEARNGGRWAKMIQISGLEDVHSVYSD